MPLPVEFFYDFSCPYAYLASTQIEPLCTKYGAPFLPRPMLLGGVFKARNVAQNMAATMAPAKAQHNMLDMHRWADRWGVTLNIPANHPQRTVTALRLVLAAPEEMRWPLSQAIYAAYWIDGKDITANDVLADCIRATSNTLDPDVLLAKTQTDAIKQALFDSTDEAIRRGVFGAPTFFVGDVMLWGQDRLPMLERMLGGHAEPTWPAATQPHKVRVIFDLSSPFSYLGVTQIEALCARHGAEVIWHPVLLGGLFRLVGTPDVPLFAMSEARQAYQTQDLLRHAEQWGVPFVFNPHFPLRTVTAQRLIVGVLKDAPTKAAALIARLYRAAWAESADMADEALLKKCCADVGVDPEKALAVAQSADTKQALFSLTQQAADLGAFGAPTFIIDDRDVFWGQDRLSLLDWALSRA